MFSINFSDLLNKAVSHLTGAERQRQIEEAAESLAEETRNEIARLAAVRLHTTADDYIAGLIVRRISTPGGWFRRGEITFEVELVGQLPNMVEQGWAGGDMKPALLAGRSAKVGKDGKRYAVVPFRHMGVAATGRNGQPFGSQYQGMLGADHSRMLGKQIERMAKQLRKGQRLGHGYAPQLRAHHVTDLYAGLQRQTTRYKGATQGKYMTFRAVSDRSDPRAWIHPGIQPAGLFKDAELYIQRVGDLILGGTR